MPLAFIRPMGESGLYHIHVVSAVDPGFGGGRPGGVDPDYGFGIGGHPGNRPPGSGVFPDNTLPETPPPVLLPGYTLVMVRNAHGVWEYAAVAPGSPPPRPLPGPPPHPGQGLPGAPARPDHSLPGTPARPDNSLPGQRPPHASGQPVPVPPAGTPENPIAPTPAPKPA